MEMDHLPPLRAAFKRRKGTTQQICGIRCFWVQIWGLEEEKRLIGRLVYKVDIIMFT